MSVFNPLSQSLQHNHQTKTHMKTEIIASHTDLVNLRNAIVAEHKKYNGDYEEMSEEKQSRVAAIEREISQLGQIHNPRISEKSRRALNLN